MKRSLTSVFRSLSLLAAWTMSMGLAGAGTPLPVTGLSGEAGYLDVELRWDVVDPKARGVLIERCFDAPLPPAEPRCETAAVLQAKVTSLRHVGLRPWFFRIASFNAEGRSDFSPLTPLLGDRVKLAPEEEQQGEELPITASLIAAHIRVSPKGRGGCDDPATMLANGFALVAAHPNFDGWRSPLGECGTGGCVYIEMRVDADGCYYFASHAGFGARPPWPQSAEDVGVVQVCSSGSAYTGRCTLFDDGSQIANYHYWRDSSAGFDWWEADFNPEGRQTVVHPSPDWPAD